MQYHSLRYYFPSPRDTRIKNVLKDRRVFLIQLSHYTLYRNEMTLGVTTWAQLKAELII